MLKTKIKMKVKQKKMSTQTLTYSHKKTHFVTIKNVEVTSPPHKNVNI